MTAPRLRLAPSPTGYFHIGTARTGLFNWLFARQTGGTFVLRIEDTDRARNRAEHVAGIQDVMRWLDLEWDEGPYFQSDRTDLYAGAVEKLLASGHAYACDCTQEAVTERARARGDKTPGYDGFCRDRDLEPGPGKVVRFRTPDDGVSEYDDLVYGRLTMPFADLRDFTIRKSNGDALFDLANVVDDADMTITHVVRGQDHKDNNHRHLLLWEALGYGPRPVYAHLPLINNAQGKKLSKRRDKVAVEDYRDEGFLPEAVRNYLVLLGWAPGDDREILTVDEMVAEFSFSAVKRAPAQFDDRKMLSVNAEYLRALPVDELVERSQAWLLSRWGAVASLAQERSRTLSEVYSLTDYLYLPEPVLDTARWQKETGAQPAFAAILDGLIDRFGDPELPWEPEVLAETTAANGAALGVEKPAAASMPLRLAVTGKAVGIPIYEALVALGRDRTLARLRAARARLG